MYTHSVIQVTETIIKKLSKSMVLLKFLIKEKWYVYYGSNINFKNLNGFVSSARKKEYIQSLKFKLVIITSVGCTRFPIQQGLKHGIFLLYIDCLLKMKIHQFLVALTFFGEIIYFHENICK